ncbi:MAG: PKD domain-containing protein [Candidatus Zixiibacteriota bacterium]
MARIGSNKSFLVAPSLVIASALVLAPGSHGQDSECGTVVTPKVVEYELERQGEAPLLAVDDTTLYYVPVSLHVVNRSDGTGGLNELRVIQALHDLNTHFVQAGIRFFRFRDKEGQYITYQINSDAFYSGATPADRLWSHDLVPNTANIWFVPNTGFCGFSTFSGSGNLGTVMDNACSGLPGNHSTIGHEQGHYFDLYHTHETAFGVECPDGTNCLTAGDLICETPADPTLSGNVFGDCLYGGPENANNCAGTYDPQTENLMSYSLKNCRDLFTPAQITKMRSTLVNNRPYLFQFDSADADADGVFDVADNCPEIFNPDQIDADLDGYGDACLHAQISLDDALGVVPHTVNFTGATDLAATAWDWDFGDGQLSTAQSPTHTYTTHGLFTVGLTVTSGDSSFTATRQNPVVVAADTLVAPIVQLDGNGQARVDIYARNTLPIRQMQVAFSWSGPFNMLLSSWSTDGLRTDYFATQTMVSIDPFNRRAAINLLSSVDGSLPLLAPDTGAVLSLFFEALETSGGPNAVTVGAIPGSALYFSTVFGDFEPSSLAGAVEEPAFICGDADGSGGVNIADVTYLIARIFAAGPAPVPPEAGDANGSGTVNIADVTFLIARIFAAGPAPVCP